MLSPGRIKELLNEPDLSDREAVEIRDYLRALAEVTFENWGRERSRDQEVWTAEDTRQPRGYEQTKEGRPTEDRPSQCYDQPKSHHLRQSL
jgi:hypothetical protein